MPAIETSTRGPMLSQQDNLPRLPVPPLQQTLDKYLKAIDPLTTPEQYERTEEIVKSFAENEGPKLQALLEKHAEGKENWLADWWQNLAYLDYRPPNVINSNPALILPSPTFTSDNEWLAYTSKMIRASLDYKHLLATENIAVKMAGSKPMCMSPYPNLLSSCRIPELKRDRLVSYPPNQSNPQTNIVVIHNNEFFSIEMYDTEGVPLNESQIQQHLQEVIAKSQTEGPAVGVLTTSNRNTWANTHKRLAKMGENASHLDKIEKSILIVCLDEPHTNTQDSKADDLTLTARQMLYGDGSAASSGNRWFDKTVQVIVGRNGHIGMNYEHCHVDGPLVAGLLDYMLDYISSPNENEPAKGTTYIEHLQFKLDKTLESSIETAKAEIDQFGSNVQLKSYIFNEFGKNFGKSIKQSPDAVIQVALQLAYYRDQGEPCATYESASTKMYRLGRTEVIRSCSSASLAFCKSMERKCNDRSSQVQAFVDAVTAHRKYTSEAVSGQGVDRHLLGLKLIAIENGMEVPDLHTDITYIKACHFKLTSSQVPRKHRSMTCFGAVVPDGYGVSYNPREEEIMLSVSCFADCDKTSAEVFMKRICKSLMDIKALFTEMQPEC